MTTANLGRIQDSERAPPLKTTLVHSHEGASPFQSKEIGESAISQVAPAIANATMTPWACAFKSCRSRRKKFIARYKNASEARELKVYGPLNE